MTTRTNHPCFQSQRHQRCGCPRRCVRVYSCAPPCSLCASTLHTAAFIPVAFITGQYTYVCALFWYLLTPGCPSRHCCLRSRVCPWRASGSHPSACRLPSLQPCALHTCISSTSHTSEWQRVAAKNTVPAVQPWHVCTAPCSAASPSGTARGASGPRSRARPAPLDGYSISWFKAWPLRLAPQQSRERFPPPR